MRSQLQEDGKIVVWLDLGPDAWLALLQMEIVTPASIPPYPVVVFGACGFTDYRRVVVGGYFMSLDEVPINFLAQLNTDGTLNHEFNPGPNGYINTLAVQSDNKILVGGGFSKINGQVRHSIVRLNPDGGLDEAFSIGP